MTAESHEVTWAPTAQPDLRRLPDKVAAAVAEFVYGPLAENPHRLGRMLRFDLEGDHAARRGDYRVIYRIDDAAHAVRIVAIDHRSDVYRSR